MSTSYIEGTRVDKRLDLSILLLSNSVIHNIQQSSTFKLERIIDDDKIKINFGNLQNI